MATPLMVFLGYDFFVRAVFSINFVKKEFTMFENKDH